MCNRRQFLIFVMFFCILYKFAYPSQSIYLVATVIRRSHFKEGYETIASLYIILPFIKKEWHISFIRRLKTFGINYKLLLSSIPVLHYAVIILCSQYFYLSMAKELFPFEGLANQGNKSKRVFALYISLILTWFRNYKEDIFG